MFSVNKIAIVCSVDLLRLLNWITEVTQRTERGIYFPPVWHVDNPDSFHGMWSNSYCILTVCRAWR